MEAQRLFAIQIAQRFAFDVFVNKERDIAVASK